MYVVRAQQKGRTFTQHFSS